MESDRIVTTGNFIQVATKKWKRTPQQKANSLIWKLQKYSIGIRKRDQFSEQFPLNVQKHEIKFIIIVEQKVFSVHMNDERCSAIFDCYFICYSYTVQ